MTAIPLQSVAFRAGAVPAAETMTVLDHPGARKVQYRLYYEAEGTVFSDGLLRQHEVPPDSVIINPHVPAPTRRRRTAASAGVAPSK